MRYFLCVILPPIAVLSTGKNNAFLLNILLTALFILPGIVHAMLIINRFYEEKLNQEILDAEAELYHFNQMNLK